MKKTFKREIANAGLVFWTAASVYLYLVADNERIAALDAVYDAQTAFTWGYAAAAYGLHQIAKTWGVK